METKMSKNQASIQPFIAYAVVDSKNNTICSGTLTMDRLDAEIDVNEFSYSLKRQFSVVELHVSEAGSFL